MKRLTPVNGPDIPAGSTIRRYRDSKDVHVDHVGERSEFGQHLIHLASGGFIPTWDGDGFFTVTEVQASA